MSKFGGALKKLQTVQAQETPQEVPVPEAPKTEGPENLNSGISENLKTGAPENLERGTPAEPVMEREKYSTYLESGLVTSLKLYAVRHRLKHHQVVEAALRAYLQGKD